MDTLLGLIVVIPSLSLVVAGVYAMVRLIADVEAREQADFVAWADSQKLFILFRRRETAFPTLPGNGFVGHTAVFRFVAEDETGRRRRGWAYSRAQLQPPHVRVLWEDEIAVRPPLLDPKDDPLWDEGIDGLKVDALKWGRQFR